jgi:amidophosphoribosyltransferase
MAKWSSANAARWLDHHRLERKPRAAARAPCLFEYVYFARPDSMVAGRSVYSARKRMGINLAKEAPVEADVVVPVPDGGTPAAIGYAQQSGIPVRAGHHPQPLCGPHLHRADPVDPGLRRSLKHSANRNEIAGKRVVLIDDSIVRGTTSVKIVQMIRDAGATEVHIRVASPMIFHSDYYGIDTPDPEKLLANQHPDLESMCRFIGADSLAFLSIDGLYDAVGGEAQC